MLFYYDLVLFVISDFFVYVFRLINFMKMNSVVKTGAFDVVHLYIPFVIFVLVT